MVIKDREELQRLKKLESLESTCYIKKDCVYKIFKPNIDIEERINIINIFLNKKIDGCPEIYDLIYKDNKVIGYIMKYYSKLMQLKDIRNFNFLKQKLLELIKLHLMLENKYSICYFDYSNNNVFHHHKSILLLDVDSCINKTEYNSEIASNILIDFILSIIYKINYFDIKPYFTMEERKLIEDVIYTNYNGEKINSLANIVEFIKNISLQDIKKQVKRIYFKFN